MENKKIIELDKDSGFCFGVVNAIDKAEEELEKEEVLYCLGDIVHNSKEVDRLNAKGLITINHEKMKELRNVKVLLRAHGEPPTTYELAEKNGITIIDATCPVVLRLQKKIKKIYQESINQNAQIVIFGKNGHAEVNGLIGQTDGTGIVIENKEDLTKVDFKRDIYLFSQTTKSIDLFNEIIEEIKQNISDKAEFKFFDTICRQVANRLPNIRKFAKNHDAVFFVSGKKSSNGKVLFEECRKVNEATFFISDENDIDSEMLKNCSSIGICGATSTPKWLMENVYEKINSLI